MIALLLFGCATPGAKYGDVSQLVAGSPSSVGLDLAQDSHIGVEKGETPFVQDQCSSVFSNTCYALVQIITSYDGRSVLAGPVQ